MQPYIVERANGTWEGRWWSVDEGRYYRRSWHTVAEAEAYAKKQGLRFVLVTH